jgi:membrane-associated phospholipid phosphatase
MSDAVKRPVAGCLCCVVGLAVLAQLAFRTTAFGHLDATVLSYLSSHDGPLVDRAARFFSFLADPLPQLVLLVAVCAVALRRGLPRVAVASVVLVGGANLTTQVLKVVLAHPRYQPILGYQQVGPTAFPSGHATAALSMACAFALVVPRPWRPTAITLGALATLAVGCSRVIQHYHYPSDVLGGWLVAAGWCFAVVATLRYLAAGTRDRMTALGGQRRDGRHFGGSRGGTPSPESPTARPG